MNNKLIFIISASFLSLFASCQEKETFPKHFSKHNHKQGKIRMFTKNGEVTDQKVIENFFNYHKNDPNPGAFERNLYGWGSHSSSNIFLDYDITFHSDSSGKIVLKIENNKVCDFNSIRNNGFITLSVHDTLSYESMDEEKPVSIYKFKPEILSEKQLPSTNFFKKRITHKRTIHAKEIDGEIHIPIVSYIEMRADSGKWSASLRGAENNMINPKYIENLKNSPEERQDTLIFKESYIIFKKDEKQK